MTKFFYFIFLIFTIPNALAGRGAIVVVDNSTETPVTITSTQSDCIDGSINQTLASIAATNAYLEATSSGLCFFSTSGSGEFTIKANSIYLGKISYSISASNNTQASVIEEATPNYKLRAYSINTLSRTSGQDIISIRITPPDNGQYKDWMWQLRTTLKNKRLGDIILPGTHDSLTNDLSSSICDADPDTGFFTSFGKGFATAQYLDFTTQLNRGIRYFDLRLCRQNNTNYIAHGLISNKNFETELNSLKQFTANNPYEIIVLDLQHIYGYDENSFKNVLDYIKTNFGDQLIRTNEVTLTDNLATIWGINYGCPLVPHSILVILPQTDYTNNILADPQYNFAWPRSTISSPWPQTTDINTMLQKNTATLVSRPYPRLSVNQLILTPDSSYITSNLSSSLEYLALQSLSNVYSWLNSNMRNGLNIYIRDWSNGYDGAIFAIRANSI